MDIQFILKDNGKGSFFIEDSGDRIAVMDIGISGKNITVYHTEVAEKLKGKGIASGLLAKMVEYARKNKLKVIPLCPYVRTQFSNNPERYEDVWNQSWHK